MDKFNNYSGVVHIHTTYSKDSVLKPLDLIPYLKKYKVDFAIITDHNNLEAKNMKVFMKIFYY